MHQYIHGMYSFLLHDASKGLFIAARDHVGIKPLYFMQTSESIEFASEAKAFTLSHGHSQPFPNQAYACIKADANNLIEFTKYPIKYDIPDSKLYSNETKTVAPKCDDLEIEKTMDEFVNSFQASVELRFQADVPICLFLKWRP